MNAQAHNQEILNSARDATGIWLRQTGPQYRYDIGDGTFPLSQSEQEINRRGGRLYAASREELIRLALEDAKRERMIAEDIGNEDRIEEIDAAVATLRAAMA